MQNNAFDYTATFLLLMLRKLANSKDSIHPQESDIDQSNLTTSWSIFDKPYWAGVGTKRARETAHSL